MHPLTSLLAPGTQRITDTLTAAQIEELYGPAAQRAEASLTPALIEPLHETTRGMEVAVVAHTKGQMSNEELWAELDWARQCYLRAAQIATGAAQHVRTAAGLSDRDRELLAARHDQEATRYTAWAEGTRHRYAELTAA